VLSAEPPLKAEVRTQIDERRKKADAALTEAAARLEDDKSPAVQALLREAKGVLGDIDQLRRRVDAELSKPRSERDAKLRIRQLRRPRQPGVTDVSMPDIRSSLSIGFPRRRGPSSETDLASIL
jgi:hypothetical protein